MKLGTKFWGSGLAVFAAVVALFGLTMAFADNINPGVVDINSKVGGLTYGQWSAKWWQRAFSLTTLDDCTTNQSGQVWFLNGTSDGTIADRKCIVPAGKNIMFPIFNSEQSVVEAKAAFQLPNIPPNQETTCTIGTTPIRDINGKLIKGFGYGPLHSCAQGIAQHALQKGASLSATVDGQNLKNPEHYRAATPPPLFPFTAVEGNPFGLSPVTSNAAADGFWIILQPLSAGPHKINFAATVPIPEVSPTPFISGANYCLIVQPSSAQTCP